MYNKDITGNANFVRQGSFYIDIDYIPPSPWEFIPDLDRPRSLFSTSGFREKHFPSTNLVGPLCRLPLLPECCSKEKPSSCGTPSFGEPGKKDKVITCMKLSQSKHVGKHKSLTP